ncbi:MAG: hypothetical protein M1548_00145 [Actinobacteria bacterium]|nr:hypothetical protein [Actinomycetota bacterium]
MGKVKQNPLNLIVNFFGTGRGFEDKERLYLVLGITTICLAAIFGLILIVSALASVIGKLMGP